MHKTASPKSSSKKATPLNRSKRIRRPTQQEPCSLSVEPVLAVVRSLWKAVEKSSSLNQNKTKQEITDTVMRLKDRVEQKLRVSKAPRKSEQLFFQDSDLLVVNEPDAPFGEPKPRFPDPGMRVYAKDLAEHALKHIPHLTEFRKTDEIRDYLTKNLRFNSQRTRRTNANYLVSRYFPGEIVNDDLPPIAAALEGTSALGEVLFYLTCRTEKIVARVAHEVVFPQLAQGGISRAKVRDFIQSEFPKSKSANQIGCAVVATYQAFGIGTATRTRLSMSLREGSLTSFAYVLHLEFPEPGMYSFDKMLHGPMHQWLLWDQSWMVRQLYALREAGLLSKVSEIDRMCQFTTKFSLGSAVARIVALAKGADT
jgi:hypothetical protein